MTFATSKTYHMVHVVATAAKYVPYLLNYLQKCNCCNIYALYAESPAEMQLSLCKHLQGQAKKDRNVLSKAHPVPKNENLVKAMQDH
jgi:hypothetical protein